MWFGSCFLGFRPEFQCSGILGQFCYAGFMIM